MVEAASSGLDSAFQLASGWASGSASGSAAGSSGPDVAVGRGHIACFVAGARIATEQGLIAVEALRAGDQVLTLDHGGQILRGCCGRSVASQGAFAAVSIPAGTFGDHGALRVSPQHRLLLSGWRAELYCGDVAVLVQACDLVRAGLLRQDQSGCPVTYYHLLFDHCEVINVDGLWSDSTLLGPNSRPQPDTDLTALFPELGLSPAVFGLRWISRATAR